MIDKVRNAEIVRLHGKDVRASLASVPYASVIHKICTKQDRGYPNYRVASEDFPITLFEIVGGNMVTLRSVVSVIDDLYSQDEIDSIVAWFEFSRTLSQARRLDY